VATSFMSGMKDVPTERTGEPLGKVMARGQSGLSSKYDAMIQAERAGLAPGSRIDSEALNRAKAAALLSAGRQKTILTEDLGRANTGQATLSGGA